MLINELLFNSVIRFLMREDFFLDSYVFREVLRDADNIIIPVKKPCSIFYQPRKETFDRNPNIKHPRDKIFLIIHKTMGQFESELQHTLFEM